MAQRYPFLSPGWIDAARAVYAKHRAEAPPLAVPIRANLVITDVPFGDGPIDAHLDTSAGELELDLGHLEGAEVTLTLDYATAKAQVVDQDQGAVVQAFMAGRIKIDGDMMKVMALAAAGVEDGEGLARRVAAELQAITE
ncbi:MAG TPA: SCP2 sterol-binding domain-containing protein [Acidimicrobiales bacterium]|nr:SCP2 sterol-binding domain-containing protein [Acidimicrobiales bacterium]